MSTPSAAPFSATTYELDPAGGSAKRVTLAPIPPNETLRLGAGFAAIDPWAKYAYTPERLASFFAGSEPSAPRFGLYADGEIAGVAALKLDWLRGPFLQFLGVLPSAPGEGSRRKRAGVDRARSASRRAAQPLGDGFRFQCSRRQPLQAPRLLELARLDGLASDTLGEILLRKRLI